MSSKDKSDLSLFESSKGGCFRALEVSRLKPWKIVLFEKLLLAKIKE